MSVESTPKAVRVDLYTWQAAIRCRTCLPNVTDTQLMYLLLTGTYMSPDGSSAHPGIRRLTASTSKNEKTTRRQLEQSVTDGLLILVSRGHRRGDGVLVASEYAASLPAAVPPCSGHRDDFSTGHLDVRLTSTGHEPPPDIRVSGGEDLKRTSGESLPDIPGVSTGHPDVHPPAIDPPAMNTPAAAGEITDRPVGETGDGPADSVREVLAAANVGPSWATAVRAALDAGHTGQAVAEVLTRPRPGARNLDAVRRAALADLAATRPNGTAPPAASPTSPDPDPEPPARPVPALPRLSRTADPASLASTVSAYDTAADPVGHALAVLGGTAPVGTDDGDDDDRPSCMDCGKRLSRDRRPWQHPRTGHLVLYCLICRRANGA